MRNNTYEWKTISKDGLPVDNGGYFVTVQITDADFPYQDSIFVTICNYINNKFDCICMKKDLKDKIRRYRIVSYVKFPPLCTGGLDFNPTEPKENDIMANRISWHE